MKLSSHSLLDSTSRILSVQPATGAFMTPQIFPLQQALAFCEACNTTGEATKEPTGPASYTLLGCLGGQHCTRQLEARSC